MIDIAACFERYEWTAERIEAGIWRTTFAVESEEDFDLYVMVSEDWVHFAVSPFVAAAPPGSEARVYAILLRLNQELRLARFALDGDGDINLLVDLPASALYVRPVCAGARCTCLLRRPVGSRST